MEINRNDGNTRALFVADSHFHVNRDPAERQRYERMIGLLDRFGGVEHLVLLGDIFDFWFDYPHFVMQGYEDLLAALDRVKSAGTRLHFVGGNHDIWAAGYLHRRYGTERGGGPLTLELDDQQVLCVHGDGLLGKDLAYRTFRSIVRHRAGICLGKSLHPEVLFALSTWLSGTSRQCTRDEIAGIERKADRWLAAQRATAWHHLVMGHVHHPYVTSHGGRRLTCLGGWLGPLNYATWRAGDLVTHQET
ncbi:MAG TPA: UDP-2,3-diacylglucosamine diphosphatase [Candidatus Krumholzibacteria bacterium]|nr:UDP-2,3-diacylglucosamine diphosphatase [Candidatus Krumholzibacteria bacterium]HPD71227.1 UDP-2,3-diacylglucosamine diphosphatase [Candidatus Krumholzibacteria bacterium]HRY39073.1 UDP-2,3-diacylglucosamine diphosphatase [Candidatus Krumholzibacteria bacterium]